MKMFLLIGFVSMFMIGLYKYWPLAEKRIPLSCLATYMQGNMSLGQFFRVLFDWKVEYRCCSNIAQLWPPKTVVLIRVPITKKKYCKWYTISSSNFVKYKKSYELCTLLRTLKYIARFLLFVLDIGNGKKTNANTWLKKDKA